MIKKLFQSIIHFLCDFFIYYFIFNIIIFVYALVTNDFDSSLWAIGLSFGYILAPILVLVKIIKRIFTPKQK